MAFFYPVSLLLVVLLAAATSQKAPLKTKEAKRLFKQKCAKCHGQDGGATNLTDPEWQERVDDKRLINSLKYGRGQMPAFGEKLTEEQITSLMLYVRTLKN